MTVYVDNARIPYGGMLMAHMVADTDDELHQMADAIGLRRIWFQDHGSIPHYDVSLAYRRKAIRLGAMPLTRRELAEIIRKWKRRRTL